MTSPNPHDWAFRPATVGEAEEACAVIRRSIIELCGADHDSEPAILDRWLANKTPDQLRHWIEADPGGVLVGIGSAGIGGVGMVMPDGKVALNYVAPWARLSGVSKGLVEAMERCAAGWGLASCYLTSTITAHGFYRAYGYRNAGEPVPLFGGKLAFPMRRDIR